MTSTSDASSGSDGGGQSSPARAAARSSRRRIGHQSPTSAVAAPSAQPVRSEQARISSAWRCAEQAGFGLGRAGRARQRADRGGQPDEIQPLALERLGRLGQPGSRGAVRGLGERELDQAGMAAVQAAQQVHRVGEVAARVRAGSLDQGMEMGMARAAVCR